jgi:hypothetical protein
MDPTCLPSFALVVMLLVIISYVWRHNLAKKLKYIFMFNAKRLIDIVKLTRQSKNSKNVEDKVRS